MSIQEIETSLLFKDKIPCADYNDNNDGDNDKVHKYNSFISCSKEKIWNNLRPLIKCKLAGFENLVSKIRNFLFKLIFRNSAKSSKKDILKFKLPIQWALF
jgi:hypothetical protein